MIATETVQTLDWMQSQVVGAVSSLRPVSLLEMLERYAFSFYEVVSALGEWQGRAVHIEKTYLESYSRDLAQLREILAKVREECKKLALGHTADMAELLESRYAADQSVSPYSSDSKKHTYGSIRDDLQLLDSSFRGELRRELFFRITPDNEEYFEKDGLFGREVAQAFPSCSDDIRNAGTCFALERYDASVFVIVQTG